jgi:hypothetical protein
MNTFTLKPQASDNKPSTHLNIASSVDHQSEDASDLALRVIAETLVMRHLHTLIF